VMRGKGIERLEGRGGRGGVECFKWWNE